MKKEQTKSKFVLILFIVISIAFVVGFAFYYINAKNNAKNNLAQNTTPKKSNIFQINKIFLFSSAHATRE